MVNTRDITYALRNIAIGISRIDNVWSLAARAAGATARAGKSHIVGVTHLRGANVMRAQEVAQARRHAP